MNATCPPQAEMPQLLGEELMHAHDAPPEMPLEMLSVTPKSKEAFVETVAVVCPEETEPQDEASTSQVVAEDPEFEMPEKVAMVEQPGTAETSEAWSTEVWYKTPVFQASE